MVTSVCPVVHKQIAPLLRKPKNTLPRRMGRGALSVKYRPVGRGYLCPRFQWTFVLYIHTYTFIRKKGHRLLMGGLGVGTSHHAIVATLPSGRRYRGSVKYFRVSPQRFSFMSGVTFTLNHSTSIPISARCNSAICVYTS